MRFIAGLVFEVATVLLQCTQQRHHFTEHFLIGLSQLCKPLLEERVAPNFRTCTLPHMGLTTSLLTDRANEPELTRWILIHAADTSAVTTLLRSVAEHETSGLGRRRKPYGSEGWGFDSLRAR